MLERPEAEAGGQFAPLQGKERARAERFLFRNLRPFVDSRFRRGYCYFEGDHYYLYMKTTLWPEDLHALFGTTFYDVHPLVLMATTKDVIVEWRGESDDPLVGYWTSLREPVSITLERYCNYPYDRARIVPEAVPPRWLRRTRASPYVGGECPLCSGGHHHGGDRRKSDEGAGASEL